MAAAGGPAVILFLLAGPESSARNRAAIILYFIFTQAVALIVYWVGGLITWKVFGLRCPCCRQLFWGHGSVRGCSARRRSNLSKDCALFSSSDRLFDFLCVMDDGISH